MSIGEIIELICAIETLEIYITKEIEIEIKEGRASRISAKSDVYKAINKGYIKVQILKESSKGLFNVLKDELGAGEASGIALAYENDDWIFASEEAEAIKQAEDTLGEGRVVTLNEILDFAIDNKVLTTKGKKEFLAKIKELN